MKIAAIRQWKAELVAGAALAALGLAFVHLALKLPPPDEPGVPGPGTVPALLGGVIAFCGLAVAAGGLMKKDSALLELGGAKQAIGMIGLALGALLFEPLGFMLATFLFLLGGFILLGGADWRRAAPAAALASGGLWLVFTKLLGVGLPYGLIGEILFR